MRCWWLLLLTSVLLGAGCGTTRWTDSARTATEQLLISDAVDRAVSRFDLRALAGKEVYLDTTRVKLAVDSEYLISSLRQHALASGCILKSKLEEAEYVVEVRSGAVGTDRNDAIFGVPATTVPATTLTGNVATAVPEIALWKKTDQRGVAKIALFAYNRETGRPVWQSGIAPTDSSAKAVWVFGAGPFRRGRIHQGMDFAGEKINLPLVHAGPTPERPSVTAEAYFTEPPAAEIARRLPSTKQSSADPARAKPGDGAAGARAGAGPGPMSGAPAAGMPDASGANGAGVPPAAGVGGVPPAAAGQTVTQTTISGVSNPGAVTNFMLQLGRPD
jgi:hypothetical protein